MQFGSLMIEFDDQVLRPRPWTIAQALWASELAEAAPDGRLLELCSGAGQIGLLSAQLCAEHGRARELVLVDADPRACGFARANAERAGLAGVVETRQARLRTALQPDERFPVIMADPPWVPTAGTARYPEDPLWAIDGGTDGLDVARGCLAVIGRHLQPGGSAILQLGDEEQAEILGADLGRVDLDQGDLESLEIVGRRQPAGANGILVRLAGW